MLFRVCAGLLFLSLGIFIVQTFRKKAKRNRFLHLSSGIILALMVVSVLGIIYYTANNDRHIRAIKTGVLEEVAKDTASRAANEIAEDQEELVQKAKENFVFRDVQLFTGIMVHLIIISVIGVAYLLLWRRSPKLPKNNYTLGYKIILALGMCIVLGFAAYACYKCVVDEEFREQVYIRTYSEFFVGNIFLMLVASMVSAAGMPEEEDHKDQSSASSS